MMKSTGRPLKTLFQLVWTNVFETLLEQKLYLERAQGVKKLDVDIDVFTQNEYF